MKNSFFSVKYFTLCISSRSSDQRMCEGRRKVYISEVNAMHGASYDSVILISELYFYLSMWNLDKNKGYRIVKCTYRMPRLIFPSTAIKHGQRIEEMTT